MTMTMDTIRIVPPAEYSGEGIKPGPETRSLLVYHGDLNLTGEGMGIGNGAYPYEMEYRGEIVRTADPPVRNRYQHLYAPSTVPVLTLRTLLGIHPLFEQIPPREPAPHHYPN